MSYSKLDTLYRSMILTKFFTKGWGKPDHLKSIFEFRRQLAKKEVAYSYVDPDHPVTIVKDETLKNYRLLQGYFRTPFMDYLPQLLPPESEKAQFQVVLPKERKSGFTPIVVHYAGTGDHNFNRRRKWMAEPLLQEKGYASLIIENPFYGCRKPKQQFRSSLQHVSDLFVMGASLILESLVIFHWCEKQNFSPIISHGLSMGGHMASLGATVWPRPIGLVPCLIWSSASVTFTKGALTGAIPWDVLEKQYLHQDLYREEVLRMIECDNTALNAGKEFAIEMDRCAKIEELKRKEILGDLPNDLNKLLFKTNKNHKEDAINSTKQTELSQEGLENLNEENNSVSSSSLSNKNYNNVLESLNLPSLSSEKILIENSGSEGNNSSTTLSKMAESFKLHPRYIVPKFIRSDGIGEQSVDPLHREAVHFMRGIMDECTHLKNYDVPTDTSLINIVIADNDGYYPREGIAALPDIWPGCNLRSIQGGHVKGCLSGHNRKLFRQAIYDCGDQYVKKYMK